MTPHDKSRLVKALARRAGFELVGVAKPDRVARAAFYRKWLAAGYGGSMAYLGRNAELREDPAQLLPGAKSVVCVGLSYRRTPLSLPSPRSGERGQVQPGCPSGGEGEALQPGSPRGGKREQMQPGVPLSGECGASAPDVDGEWRARENVAAQGRAGFGQVAQYARGADYHVVMRRILKELVAGMRAEVDEPFEARVFVDTGPLLERELAAAAGLGWIGKNTMLLNSGVGSFFFLGEIVATLELAADTAVADHCGSCTRCLDACPTAAFPAPYQMDASRCISYFTIEHRGEVPREFQARIGDWVYGCDVCQDVCPFNAKAPLGTQPEIVESRIAERLPLLDLLELTPEAYKRLTAGTAADRASLEMWRRNARIVAGK